LLIIVFQVEKLSKEQVQGKLFDIRLNPDRLNVCISFLKRWIVYFQPTIKSYSFTFTSMLQDDLNEGYCVQYTEDVIMDTLQLMLKVKMRTTENNVEHFKYKPLIQTTTS